MDQAGKVAACLALVSTVEGWLYDEEVELLYRLASGVREGVIVEIGSYRGKSTVALALGSRDGSHAPVFAVDPHEDFTGVSGFQFGPRDRDEFSQSILRCGVSELVRPVSLTSAAAAEGWDLPVGLLWIDGDHRYESVKLDLDLWRPYLAPRAFVALHDSVDPNLAPWRVIREEIHAGRFEQIELVGSTTVLSRR